MSISLAVLIDAYNSCICVRHCVPFINYNAHTISPQFVCLYTYRGTLLTFANAHTCAVFLDSSKLHAVNDKIINITNLKVPIIIDKLHEDSQ